MMHGAPVPGLGAIDQAMTLLKAAADPEAIKKRIVALQDATRTHDDARRKHEASERAIMKAQENNHAREIAIIEKEAQLKAAEKAYQQAIEATNAGFERTTAALNEREAALNQGKTELAQKVNEFSHYRERELAAIQAKHDNVNKLMKSVEQEMKELESLRAAVGRRIENFLKLRDEIMDRLKTL